MTKSLRFGTALTAIGLVAALSACAHPAARMAKAGSFVGGKPGANVGIATRAQAAIEAQNWAAAITYAEQAVATLPNDGAYRALLGNAYFGGGRFASAEQAYRDALSLDGNQPAVVLKLALVTIAQGKKDSAVALLDQARNLLDPADYGLALALAGQPTAAVAVLDEAARQVGADGRVRQNLALALALSGDWQQAKVVAGQDLAADQVDSRVQQWMGFAKPTNAYDQVAALTGVSPAASDPGQPIRLALARSDVRQAAAAPVATTAPVAVAAAAPAIEQVPVEAPPVEVAAVAPASAPPAVDLPAPLAQTVAIAAPALAPVMVATQASSKPSSVARPGLSSRVASLRQPVRASFHRAAFARGSSKSVVQLGAYGSRAGVNAAWARFAAKYPALRGYNPATAQFNATGGQVYRLSVSGFGSDGQARDFCVSLKRSGGACFVRTVAGDRPVQLASL